MRLYNEEELKNSRIFFDKKPPRYLFVLNSFLIFLLVSAIFVSKHVPKIYAVNAVGSIEADDKFYLTPTTNGAVVTIHREEGEQVKKGDLLLTLSVGVEGVQEEEIQKQLEELEKKKALFDKYEASLNDDINYLKNSGEEQGYYGKVAYYLEQVESEGKNKHQTKGTIQDKKMT